MYLLNCLQKTCQIKVLYHGHGFLTHDQLYFPFTLASTVQKHSVNRLIKLSSMCFSKSTVIRNHQLG